MKYSRPEIEVVKFDIMDVITTSVPELDSEVGGNTPEVDTDILPTATSIMD